MNYPTIVLKALDRLASIETTRSNKAPPLHRLAWRAGIPLPPPLLASFHFNLMLMGAWFGLGWGLSMFLFFAIAFGRDPVKLVPVMAVVAIIAGVLFGLAMATYFRHIAVKHHLPSWRSFKASVQT